MPSGPKQFAKQGLGQGLCTLVLRASQSFVYRALSELLIMFMFMVTRCCALPGYILGRSPQSCPSSPVGPECVVDPKSVCSEFVPFVSRLKQ